ncbi:MAG TPA: AraC family transcriptional regulator [Arachidicoccus sp.]|nr:AraC family transcriptional regulator [Arachidicoccus sp.]
MEKKKDGFEGQRAIVLPRTILSNYCSTNPMISRAYITDIGYYPKAKHHYRERTAGIDQNILIYCQDGKGSARIGNMDFNIQPGEYILIPAGTPHRYEADAGSPWSIYWVHFKGDHAHLMVNHNMHKMGTFKGAISFQQKRIQLFEEMYANLLMGYSPDNLCFVNSCFTYYLSSFVFPDNYNHTDKEGSNDTVHNAIAFMQEHIDQILSLEAMAAHVNLSISHFSFLFKKKTGFSPIEHFKHLKVQKACQYLLFTDLRIKEIADKLGIEDPYYFSRMFSKVMGMSPASYRIKRIN